MNHTRPHTAGHSFNSEGVCTRCGFDSTEWRWWKFNTTAGINSRDPMPGCEPENSNNPQR